MATGTILLPIEGCELPDGTGTGNAFATLDKKVSTGVQTANSPKETFTVALFDAAADEHVMWNFRMPQDYSAGSNLSIIIQFYNATAQVGTLACVWKFALKAVTPDVDAVDREAQVFATVQTVTETLAADQAARNERTVTGTLSNLDALAAGDDVTLFVGRDADAAGDTMTGDAALMNVVIEYTTT